MQLIHKTLWTSDLIFTENLSNIIKDVTKTTSIFEFVKSGSENYGRVVIPKSFLNSLEIPKWEDFYWRPDKLVDYTCIAKGIFIELVKNLADKELDEYLINFGGDIYIKSKDSGRVNSKYDKIIFVIKNQGSVFCSTNKEREGHIPHSVADVCYSFNNLVRPFSNDYFATTGLTDLRVKKVLRTTGGNIDNKTYIASPFFNDTDVSIRDKMVSHFTQYIRPDLLNPNIEGDLNKDPKLAAKIKSDNLEAIDECEVLVFPINTIDLGTLYEVGYAISKNKIIIRYNYDNDYLEVLVNPQLPKIHPDELKSIILDLNRLGSGIILGAHYEYPIACYLGSSRDNIMLMDNPHIDEPKYLYPCYLPDILTESTYRLNTLTSGS